MDSVEGETKAFVSSVYNVSIDSIQMALALTVGLAWYAFVKGGISKVYPEHGNKLWGLGLFAIIITAIFAAVLYLIKNILKTPVSERPILYTVSPGMM